MNLDLTDLEFRIVEVGCCEVTFALSVNAEPDE